jgi:GNAT superfamily N-acetyltransferase
MSALAQRVAQSIHENLASSRNGRVGPFTVLIDKSSANVWRNYAVPDSGATPSAADVAALVECFKTRGRTPRIEYVPSDAPAVEPALTQAGFEVEGRPPLMACRPGQLTAAPVAGGFDVRVVDTPEDLLDVARVQDAAYRSTEPTGPDDVARLQNTVRLGGRVVLARETRTGVPVGAGLVTGPVDGVSELAAVGVIEAYRRRGVASAVTAALTIAAMESGAEIVWLEPAGEREAAIYARAGFRPDGEKLWISLPGRSATPSPVDFDHAAAGM